MTRPVVVVGAGVGGLACAARLLARGVEVTVLEAAAAPGGKLREVSESCPGGATFDAGPTVLTMRWVFETLFADHGVALDDALPMARAQVLARHAWDARGSFDLHADVEATVDAIATLSGPAEAQRYRAFCRRAAGIYRTLEQPFLESAQPTPFSLSTRVGLRGLPGLLRISPFATLWSALSKDFHDPRLRQLFGRYATYCGSSPFLAPATLMLIAHVEREGVWLVAGGMQRIAEALARLVASHGGSVRCDAPVATVVVERGRAVGVVLASGERVDASAVVFNGDSAALAEGLLGDAARPAVRRSLTSQRSLSAITWHFRARTSGFPLSRHNVFFGGDSATEFADLFRMRDVPGDPTVYVCAQDRDARIGPTPPAGEPERLMCLVNAPADGDTRPLAADAVERCTQRMLARIAACGLRIDAPVAAPLVTTPTGFAALFPATGGALYGRATHGWTSSFTRPSSRSHVAGLYLTGGSVHPGAGLPMAALSGRLAADRLMEDLPSST